MGKYVDTSAIIQVIGNIYNNPSILDMEDKYHFYEEDFPEEFHRVLFGSIYNLHALGAKEINVNTIEDYLQQRPKHLAIYESHKGADYLTKISNNVQYAAFDYYYQRMKKMTLLRMYNQQAGLDLKWLYDIDNIFDVKKRQAQEDWFDNTPIEVIADTIDQRISDIRIKYVDNTDTEIISAGTGAEELLEQLKQRPEIGYPLYGPLVNTITRGARLKKFYLRSAATGVGKTRSMIADACSIACDEIFDKEQGIWVNNGTKEPTLFIATEQELDEVQTMMIAFLSNVNEDHIVMGNYYAGEWERVIYAAQLLKKCPIYTIRLKDFSLQDIENTVKHSIRDHETRYIFFDYLHSSMKILEEVSSKAKVKGLREDNVLFMISTRLKDICNEYGVFVMTATQLNAEYKTAQQYDQNLLRGAKSIADKIDVGMIMLEVSQDDRAALEEIIKQGFEMPTIKISVYKNRRGRYKDILMWCREDRGTCKIEPIFVTDYQYELVAIEDLRIKIKEESAFEE